MIHPSNRQRLGRALAAGAIAAALLAGVAAPTQWHAAAEQPAAPQEPAAQRSPLMRPLADGLALDDASLESAIQQPDHVTAWAELNLILHAASGPAVTLAHALDDEVVVISTRQDLQRDIQTRIYDIRRLLAEPFPPPDQLTPPQREQMAALAQPIIDLLTRSVEPAAWKQNGGTVGAIQYLNGQLVVTATPEIHEAIGLLLNRL